MASSIEVVVKRVARAVMAGSLAAEMARAVVAGCLAAEMGRAMVAGCLAAEVDRLGAGEMEAVDKDASPTWSAEHLRTTPSAVDRVAMEATAPGWVVVAMARVAEAGVAMAAVVVASAGAAAMVVASVAAVAMVVASAGAAGVDSLLGSAKADGSSAPLQPVLRAWDSAPTGRPRTGAIAILQPRPPQIGRRPLAAASIFVRESNPGRRCRRGQSRGGSRFRQS